MVGGSTGKHSTTVEFVLETDAPRLWRAILDESQKPENLDQVDRCHGPSGNYRDQVTGSVLSAHALKTAETEKTLPAGTGYALTPGALELFSCESLVNRAFLNRFQLIKYSGTASTQEFKFSPLAYPEGSQGAGVGAGVGMLGPEDSSLTMAVSIGLPETTYLVQEDLGAVTENTTLDAFALGGQRGSEGVSVTIEGRTDIAISFNGDLSATGMMQIKMRLTLSSDDKSIIQELQKQLTLLQNYQWLNTKPFQGIPFMFSMFLLNEENILSQLSFSQPVERSSRVLQEESDGHEGSPLLGPSLSEGDVLPTWVSVSIEVGFDTAALQGTFPQSQALMDKQKEKDVGRTQVVKEGEGDFSELEPALCSQGWTSFGVGLMVGFLSPVTAQIGNAEGSGLEDHVGRFIVSRHGHDCFKIRNSGSWRLDQLPQMFLRPDGLEEDHRTYLGKLVSVTSELNVPVRLSGRGSWVTHLTMLVDRDCLGLIQSAYGDPTSLEKFRSKLQPFTGEGTKVNVRLNKLNGVMVPLLHCQPRPLVPALPANSNKKVQRILIGALMVVAVLAVFVAVSAATHGAGTLPMLWGALKLMTTLVGGASGAAAGVASIGTGAFGGFLFHKRQEKKALYQALPSDDKGGAASGQV